MVTRAGPFVSAPLTNHLSQFTNLELSGNLFLSGSTRARKPSISIGRGDMESGAEFKPYIPAEQDIPEFTPKAILLGVVFGIIFGAATVYLALRAGLTVSASVPIAVLSIAVFKKVGKSTILENN